MRVRLVNELKRVAVAGDLLLRPRAGFRAA